MKRASKVLSILVLLSVVIGLGAAPGFGNGTLARAQESPPTPTAEATLPPPEPSQAPDAAALPQADAAQVLPGPDILVGPPAPELNSPDNGNFTNDANKPLKWYASATGDTYQVQIARTATFASPVRDHTGASGELSYYPAFATDGSMDGKFYWHVRAYDISAQAGPWSVTRYYTLDTQKPNAPALSLPLEAAEVVGTPTFKWMAVPGAVSYGFALATDRSFTYKFYEVSHIIGTSFKPAITDIGLIFWRVVAHDAADNQEESEVRAVNIDPRVPGKPVLLSPLNNAATNDPTPTFQWGSVPYGFYYEVEHADNTAFTGAMAVIITGLSWDSDILANGTKNYWHVRGQNADLQWGPWSGVRTVTIDFDPPPAPVLSSPVDTAIVHGTPVFKWKAASTANAYQLDYDDSSDCSSPLYYSPDLTTTTHTPPSMGGGTYYWCVRARDAALNWGNWSAVWRVDIHAPIPAKPVLITPLNGAVISDTTPALTWGAAANANIYEVQVDALSTFPSPFLYGGISLTSFDVSPDLPLGKWYWRVRAINVDGDAGLWSSYRNFTIQ